MADECVPVAVNGTEGSGQLVVELRAASAEASVGGFYRMARVLDECTLVLDGDRSRSRNERREGVEHARQSLELWRALREW
jgi:hypothetical protein